MESYENSPPMGPDDSLYGLHEGQELNVFREGFRYTFKTEGEMILVRNVGVIPVQQGYIAKWQAGHEGKRIDGYANGDDHLAGVVRSKRIAPGDLGWILVNNTGVGLKPIAVKTPLDSGLGAGNS